MRGTAMQRAQTISGTNEKERRRQIFQGQDHTMLDKTQEYEGAEAPGREKTHAKTTYHKRNTHTTKSHTLTQGHRQFFVFFVLFAV